MDSQNQNINFLPPDIEAKAQAVKSESKPQTEYTEPERAASAIGGRAEEEKRGGTPDFLTRRKLPPLAAPSETNSTDAPASGGAKSADAKDFSVAKEPHRPWWAKLFARRKKEEPSSQNSPTAEASASVPAMPERLPAGPAAEPPVEDAAGSGQALVGAAGETLGVNLLSAEYAQAFVLKNRAAVAVWTAVASILALAAGYTGALLYESRKTELLEAARSRNQAVSAVIVTYRDLANEDELLRRKILALKFLLKKHISLKTFLEKLEAVTVAEVTYLNIAVAANGGVNMAARASDYTAAARQLAIFKTEVPWLKEVVMSGARRTAMAESKQGGVSFDLALKVEESVFISGK